MSDMREGRKLDHEALKALAHPLRVKIFDALSIHGPATASGLAERLGESSGATSYHLRQLEKHEFIREVAGRGVGRERWWERVPGGINVAMDPDETSGVREVSQLLVDQWHLGRTRELERFLREGRSALDRQWIESSVIGTVSTWATATELGLLSERVMAVLDEFADAHRDQRTPGSRPIQLHFNAFPVVDGEEIPQEGS